MARTKVFYHLWTRRISGSDAAVLQEDAEIDSNSLVQSSSVDALSGVEFLHLDKIKVILTLGISYKL